MYTHVRHLLDVHQDMTTQYVVTAYESFMQ